MKYTMILTQMAEDGNLYDTVIASKVDYSKARAILQETLPTLFPEDDECVTVYDEHGEEVTL